MDKIGRKLEEVTDYLDQNIRGVQIGCYSVALIGLTVALRRVRPFSKFKRPSDIPDRFLSERRELTGTVVRIEPDGGLLMIRHRPLIDLPIVPSGRLPVKIAGVKVSGLGLSWLQAVVAGGTVKFVPVVKERDYVQCRVMIEQVVKDKKQRPQVEVTNVGETLLKIGFATREEVPRPLVEDPSFLSYYKVLVNAERYALRKQLGNRYYLLSARDLLLLLSNRLSNLPSWVSKVSSKVQRRAPKIIAL